MSGFHVSGQIPTDISVSQGYVDYWIWPNQILIRIYNQEGTYFIVDYYYAGKYLASSASFAPFTSADQPYTLEISTGDLQNNTANETNLTITYSSDSSTLFTTTASIDFTNRERPSSLDIYTTGYELQCYFN